MKKWKVGYLVLGFVVGVSYLVACGGSSSSVAAAIGNAIDVVYDNVTSGLTAINVQAAIDENAAAITDLQSSGSTLSDQIVGTWNGSMSGTDYTITLSSDGTQTNDIDGSCFDGTYVVAGNMLILQCDDTNRVYGAGIADSTLYLTYINADLFEGTK